MLRVAIWRTTKEMKSVLALTMGGFTF